LRAVLDHVPARDRLLHAVDGLVEERGALDHLPAADRHREIAVAVEAQCVGTLEVEPDLLRVRAGGHHEVIGQLRAAAAVDHVHAGIDVVVLDPGELRHVRLPLRRVAAREVIAAPGLLVESDAGRRAGSADNLDVQHTNLGIARVREHRRTGLARRGDGLAQQEHRVRLP
jgi:hypothetical protein